MNTLFLQVAGEPLSLRTVSQISQPVPVVVTRTGGDKQWDGAQRGVIRGQKINFASVAWNVKRMNIKDISFMFKQILLWLQLNMFY